MDKYIELNRMSTTPKSPKDSPQPISANQTDSALTQTIRLLARLGRESFFGKVTISFEAGSIVTLRKEQTLKPNELGG
jgi:hypothetical protein